MLPIKKTSLALTLLVLNAPTFSADQLPAVVVSATRSAQSTVTTPSSINIITAEDIQRSGAQHIVELLKTQAIIQLNDLYGSGSRVQISMRGFADNAKSNTLIMVDGRRLNNPDLGAPDLSSIALKDVKQIEIIQGSAGTLYGDQAVGGVINIITKKPQGKSASLTVEYGSYNSKNIIGSISNKVDNLSYRLSFTKRQSDNYRKHNKEEYLNLLGRIDYKSGNTNLFVDLQSIDEKLELPGSLTKTKMEDDPRQANASYPDDFNRSKTNIQRVGLNTILNSNWNLEAEYTQRDTNITGIAFNSDIIQKRNHQGLTPRLIGSIPTSNGDTLLTLGIDYNSYDYLYKSSSTTTDATQLTKAIYLQSVIPISEKTKLTLGGRHARSDYNIKSSSLKIKNDATVFEAGISTQMSKTTRVFIRVDQNFRFAKIDENTYTSSDVKGLKTQKGTSYELGTEWKNKKSSAKIIAYALNLTNEIDYDTTAAGPGSFAGANANLDPTKRTGLILEGSHQFNSDFSLNAQYNYIDGVFDGGSFNGNKIPFVAEQNLTLNALYKISKAWSTTAEANYISSRFQAADYKNSNDKLPEVTIINAQLRYQLKNWAASFRVNNLANIKYASYATFNGYYTAPERNVMARVGYNF